MAKLSPGDCLNLWESGTELCDAWFAFSDLRNQKLFRSADCRGRPGRQIGMLMDIWEQLNTRRLIAAGHRVKPTVSNGPVIVPKHVFSERPPRLSDLTNDVDMSGWRYERVKVFRALPLIAGENQSAQVPDEKSAETTTKRGGGRPSLFMLAKPVLDEIWSDPAYPDPRAGPVLDHFNNLYLTRYTNNDGSPAPISERALRNYLRDYRQELAQTGKIKLAD